MKKTVLFLVLFVLLIGFVQVAFADPAPPNAPPTAGSCHMIASVWGPGEGPGNANGVEPGERGMYHVHTKDMPEWVGEDGYTYGAIHMDSITGVHCGGDE
jgi:hypothetical protein